MIRRGHVLSTLVAFATLCVASPQPCRADLFAVATGPGSVVRIDSDTLEVTNTYPNPFGVVGPSAFVGVAFDGRMLSWTRSVAGGSFHEFTQFDVIDEVFLPPVPLFGILPPYQISGLGALGPEFGGSLLAVAGTTFPGSAPGMFYRIEPFGGAIPLAGELPPLLTPLGLDVDPNTGEIWVAVRNFEEPPIHNELLRVSIPELQPLAALASVADDAPLPVVAGPTIEQVIQLAFIAPAAVRGVAFDDGHLFVASGNRQLFELDRVDGTLLRSVQLPGSFIIGGIAGGVVIPEPSTALLLAFAAAAGIQRRKRRREAAGC
jgi:hypothetical protein